MSQGQGKARRHAQAPPQATGDGDLVTRALARDETAVRDIMKANNRRLYRLARGILRNDTEAEDVVQGNLCPGIHTPGRIPRRSEPFDLAVADRHE